MVSMSRRLLLVLPLLLAPVAGCSQWAYSSQPFAAGPEYRIGNLRLVLATGDTVVLSKAFLRNDSVVGLIGKPPREAAYANADITSLEVRKSDPLGTARSIFEATSTLLDIAGMLAWP
jgi:hypothetical protein